MTRRSAWLIIAAAVLPLILLFVLQGGFSAREQRQRIENEAVAQAKVVIAASDAVVARTIGALDVLATAGAIRSGDMAAAYRRARDVAEVEPDWAGVTLTRLRDGALLFDTRLPLGADLKAEPRPPDGGPPVGPVLREGAGCPCVAISQTASGTGGPYRVTVLHSTRPFARLLPPTHGRYEVSALVTRDGVFVGRSLNNAERTGRQGSKYLLSAVSGGAQSGLYRGFTLEGFENYTAFARSRMTGWSAHLAMANRAIDEPRRRALGSLAIAGLLSLVFAALIIAFVLRQLAEGRRNAERFQQTQKLEALGQLTGGIAHDFNNLLTPIVGALDFLSKRDGLDPRARRMAASGLSSASRAAKLTGQLLAFSRHQKLSLQPVEICALLDEIRPLLAQSAGSGIPVEISMADGPCWVETDPLQLELALINLVINARDASAPGEPIKVSVEPVAHPGQPAWQVAVADRGAGMSEEVKRRAFDPFFTTKQMGRGTGLGLAQVFALAQQSRGEVRIDSAPGAGTRVALVIPACPPPAAGAPPPAAWVADAQPAVRILVVDDEDEVRDTIAVTLQDDGHEVDVAASGAEALTKMDEQTYALALVDFAMPGMNGAELIAQARAAYPEMRFLIVTGYVTSEAVEAAAPDTAVLLKPFDPDVLRRTVRQIAGA